MRRGASVALLLLGAAGSAVRGQECPAVAPGEPRTLVIALDGVPFRVMAEARKRGAFAGWAEPVPLVSTFPSVTNVAFTAMFQPFDVDAAGGYEVQFYDHAKNEVVGGRPWGYTERLFAWRDVFDVTGTTVGSKLSVYTHPRKKGLKEFEKTAELVLSTDQDFVLAHVGSTDAMMHLRGDEKVTRFLTDLDRRLVRLREEHEERDGRALRIVLLSDHGNTQRKIKSPKGLRKPLRREGLRPWNRLSRPGDVVAATFGIVNYGALHMAPADAETAARAIAGHKRVRLATWVTGDREIGVVSGDGEARVRWREGATEREFAYVDLGGDPLRLAEAARVLSTGNTPVAPGFFPATDWLQATIDSEYPDAPRRLVDGLTGDWVVNRGTVLFSLEDGFGWGWKTAHASSWLAGGNLEGTHGGLDRDSSIGFYLVDDAVFAANGPMSARTVFERFTRLEHCRRLGDTHFAKRATTERTRTSSAQRP